MTQAETVLRHLEKNGSITAYEAVMDHQIIHLPRRILDLIEQGVEIRKEWRKNEATGKRYIRYYLEDAA